MSKSGIYRPEAILCLDFETSGLSSKVHQGLQVGAIVLSADFKDRLGECCISVRFDDSRFQWTKEAELINGRRKDDIQRRPSLREGALEFASFLRQHFDPNIPIVLAAHNPQFDYDFLKQWLREAGVDKEFKISHRQIDTYTLGRVLFDCRNSDELFQHVGIIRGDHDACEDVEAVVRILQCVRGIREFEEFDSLKAQPVAA